MSAKVFVGRLSWGTTSEDLTSYFSTFGEVVDAIVIKERDTGRSKGFGFVTFASQEQADEAIKQANDAELDGRQIKVAESKEREPRSYNNDGASRGFRSYRRNEEGGSSGYSGYGGNRGGRYNSNGSGYQSRGRYGDNQQRGGYGGSQDRAQYQQQSNQGYAAGGDSYGDAGYNRQQQEQY
ncbi:hypothetical protein H4219_005057 [Mycoemilia scoparia]|uniref:RRM domain-containing protein n=1 Tax=Mycoemilia scoparia TaxID=417184 RepID=A0A9W8DQS8_9FUNG|nr:hypothetical protein H4219_005057 [Mycoemilia scoparia]